LPCALGDFPKENRRSLRTKASQPQAQALSQTAARTATLERGLPTQDGVRACGMKFQNELQAYRRSCGEIIGMDHLATGFLLRRESRKTGRLDADMDCVGEPKADG
jgi:hypothetical protein